MITPAQQHWQNVMAQRAGRANEGVDHAACTAHEEVLYRLRLAQARLPPSPGEQVVIACIGGNPETAMIIGSLWSDANPAPGKSLKEIVVSAPDGAVFRYDADAGALSASGMKTATLQASVSVTLDTPVVECTDLLRTATLDVTKGGKMSGNITHSGGNFTSNGITVHTHKHGGVKGGSDSTGGPQ